jgi:hypothetical protein
MKQTDAARNDSGAVPIAPEPAASRSGWRRIPLAGARDEAVRAGVLQRRADARREAALRWS